MHDLPTHGPGNANPAGLVSLSWYELEETREAVEALWKRLAGLLLAAGFRDVPHRLARGIEPLSLLGRADLLLTQTCGFLAGGVARERVKLVATPCYAAPGCDGDTYTSFVVIAPGVAARSLEALRGARLALSDPLAHSGCNALRAMVAPLHRNGRFFSGVVRTGSHVASLERLAGGSADVAAIDCITHELVRRFRPRLLAGTRVLVRTAAAPAPPFVTAATVDDDTVSRLREALGRLVRDEAFAPLRDATLLRDVVVPDPDAYARLQALAWDARDTGYLEMGYEGVIDDGPAAPGPSPRSGLRNPGASSST